MTYLGSQSHCAARKRLLLGACAVALAAASSPAMAAEATAEQDSAANQADNGGIQDIVVTAQRRSERMQDVPIAVTAIGGEELKQRGIQSSADLATSVPSLSFNTQLGGLGQPRIRGVGTAASGPGLENPVAVYIDGFYYGAQTGALLNLRDVSQVAVLKGPQGTLFGRNATGGLIQITSRDPSQELTGDVSATYGSFDTVGADVYLAGGLTDGVANGLTFHMDNQYTGYGKNFFNGLGTQTHRSYAVRDKLVITPDEATKITLQGAYSYYTGANTSMQKVANITPAYPAGFGPWDVYLNTQPTLTTKLYSLGATIQRDIGGVRLTSLTGYVNSRFVTTIDADQLPANNVVIDFDVKDKSLSQELQLSSLGSGPVTWVAGLYYYRARSGYLPIITRLYAFGSTLTLNSHSDLDSYAGYAQATYKIGDRTNLTGGLRYTIDDRSFDAVNTAVSSSTTTTTASDSHVFRKVTWRLSLDHHFTPSILGYVSYNRGFKSGFYEPQTLPALLLLPETLDAYEVGLKTDLFDRKVRFNIAAYYNDYKNVQVTQIYNSRQTVFNGDGAKMYGFDADLTVAPTSNLELTAGVSLIHGRYGAFQQAFLSTPNLVSATGGNVVTLGPLAPGKRIQNTPDFTLDLGFNYTIPTSIGDFSLGGTFYHNSGYFSEPENRVRQSDYNLVGASLRWRSTDKKYDIQVVGKNLGNVAYAAQLNASGTGDNRQTAAPRTIMITAGVHF
ncbi:TonB-dependent receptor [Novosphingobium flavum]|uniref:TonB-dependent receptor n=1 Tax=Novosphingobium flavum TaxID=1778672 RepID=A0A7X1FU21_9SPHN|nr:TonB-dependent receptor [Novosphingobium flavum]MBC2666983.1 TonB-dependent receptor [Novosphingobium flavum]